jgi:hypothetical protein
MSKRDVRIKAPVRNIVKLTYGHPITTRPKAVGFGLPMHEAIVTSWKSYPRHTDKAFMEMVAIRPGPSLQRVTQEVKSAFANTQ